jgi:hypothetical protein
MNTLSSPRPAARSKSFALLLAAGISVLTSAASFGQTLIDYNFNSLSNGVLVGQDSWALGSAGFVSPAVATVGGSQVAANSASTGTSIAKKTFFAAGDVSSSETVTLAFDAARTAVGGTNTSVFGIGSSSATSAYFGMISNNFIIRGENFGTTYTATNLTADVGDVFTIQSVWNLSTGMATLYAKNITDGATEFTQLIFTGGVTSVSLGITTDVSTWTTGYVRTAQSGASAGYLDNLSAVAVPEPGVSGLLLGGGLAFLLARRKRPSLA